MQHLSQGKASGSFPAHLDDGVHPNQVMYFWVGLLLFKGIDAALHC